MTEHAGVVAPTDSGLRGCALARQTSSSKPEQASQILQRSVTRGIGLRNRRIRAPQPGRATAGSRAILFDADVVQGLQGYCRKKQVELGMILRVSRKYSAGFTGC